MNTETMNMKEINDVHAIVEIGEDNTTALIVDPRTPIQQRLNNEILLNKQN